MRRLGSGAGCGVPRVCLASTSREAGGPVRALLRGLCRSCRLDGDRITAGNRRDQVPGRMVPQPKIAAVGRRKAFPWPLVLDVSGIMLRLHDQGAPFGAPPPLTFEG